MRIRQWSKGALALVVLFVQACAGGAHYAKSEAAPSPEEAPARAAAPPGSEGYGYAFGGDMDSPDGTGREKARAPSNALGAAPVNAPTDAGKTTDEAQRAPLLIYSANLVLSVFEAKSGLAALEAPQKRSSATW